CYVSRLFLHAASITLIYIRSLHDALPIFNRIDDDVLARALETPELAHYAPWLRDLRAMRPYQLSDEVETLLHEKSVTGRAAWNRDRKSTRLNSSHVKISYAVFCLKKKN